MARKRPTRIKPEVRTQVLELVARGVAARDIAPQVGLSETQIGGIISTSKNRMVSGSRKDAGVSALSQPQASRPSLPASLPSSVPSQPPVSNRDWQQGSSVGGGYTVPGYALYYQVERLEPTDGNMQGLLGKFDHEITDHEIGTKFGSGYYRITKHQANQPLVQCFARISGVYGPPKVPALQGARPGYRSGSGYRPGMTDRLRSIRGIDEDEEPLGRRYFERPTPPREDDDRGALAEFARHGAHAGESIAVAAVQQLGKIHEITLKQRDEERKGGPATFLTNFMDKQQSVAERQHADERKRAEERLADERRRAEQARKDEEERWQQRQREIDAQHKRDLERIEAENKSREKVESNRLSDILQLYDKRMELADKEAANREQRLKDDLERARLEAKADRDALMAKLADMTKDSEERIANMQEELKDELEKERGTLKEHHSLKMKALDNEFSLRGEMLKLREDVIKNQNSDGIEKMLGKLAEGVERTVKEVVDLKKIQAVSGLSPEAQAAHVVQGADANVQDPRLASQPSQQAGAAKPRTVSPPEKRPGNGHGTPTPQEQRERDMENQVKQHMHEPAAQDLIKEWGLNLSRGEDATAFANMFLGWMKNESTPKAAEVASMCTSVVAFIKPRSWAEIYKIIQPAIPAEVASAFTQSNADEFYETFRVIVVESVKDYYMSYLEAKRQERAALAQQRQQQQGTAPTPAVAPTPVPERVGA